MDVIGPSLTGKQFCKKHNIGRTKYFEEKKLGRIQVAQLGPRKDIITARQEAAYLELIEREAAAARTSEPTVRVHGRAVVAPQPARKRGRQ